MSTATNDEPADSDSEATEEEIESGKIPFPTPLSAVVRFLLPVALVLLSINYINETWGRIRVSNLQYPYFVIGMMCLLLLLVAIEEVGTLRKIDRDITSREAIRDYFEEWRVSIVFGALAVAYVWLISVIGFFSASFAVLIAAMYAAGARSYKIVTIVVVGVLAIVWVMFVEVLGVSPPSGLIDQFFV